VGVDAGLVAENTALLKKSIAIRESTFSGNSGNAPSPDNQGGGEMAGSYASRKSTLVLREIHRNAWF